MPNERGKANELFKTFSRGGCGLPPHVCVCVCICKIPDVIYGLPPLPSHPAHQLQICKARMMPRSPTLLLLLSPSPFLFLLTGKKISVGSRIFPPLYYVVVSPPPPFGLGPWQIDNRMRHCSLLALPYYNTSTGCPVSNWVSRPCRLGQRVGI